jgi:ribosomal protein S18 acetylase RimI-like enzyme
MLRRVHARPGHPASVAFARVAEAEGRVAGVVVGFPSGEGEELARRFLALTAWRIPPWRWRRLVRHLNAAAGMSPAPAPGSWYVDALAVAADARRRGVARALLADAEAIARAQGATGVSLDTGLENEAARRLYESSGYKQRDIRRARNERAARAIGGAGFIGYFKAV